VNVLGHDDVGPQLKAQLRARFLHRVNEPQACPIFAEQRFAAVAGECQLSGVTGHIVTAPALSDWRVGHHPYVIRSQSIAQPRATTAA
jgi:hypothetical protein